MKNKVLVFDLDGTVLDTFLLIEKTVYKTFEEKLPNYPLTLAEAHAFFGPLLNDSFTKYADSKEEAIEIAESMFKSLNTDETIEFMKGDKWDY